jgi:serine/threonine-protein kinase
MDPAQLQPGYRLDRYELLCPLAYGGMASVWLARFGGRLGFERLVVVKMILPQFSQDPRFQEMFLDEARIASRIEHTNVARILDVGEHDGNYFIVMEWVDGDSLSKILRAAEQRKQRVPAGIALRIVADAAAGLHAAHELKDRDGHSLGVVHRDVSPQNILISNNGATMLIDFGVAKARDRVSQDTSAGQLKGKIRYMAPEQALGKFMDRRADVWALGTIVYELFTGNAPYEGVNEVASLHKLTSGQPPAPLPPTVPPPVRAVILRALGYEPEQRFGSTLELALALESAMVEIGDPTSITAVAAYTAHLLADRKSARKRAVDSALQSARARDTATATSGTTSTTGASAPMAPIAGPSSHNVAAPAPVASAHSDIASRPGASGAGSASGLGSASGVAETPSIPSATSSATLGSAAIEYPPDSVNPFDQAARRKRYVIAAVLGVSLAAGLVGAVLIVSTAIMRTSTTDGNTASSASTSASVGAPPEPTADPVPPPVPAVSMSATHSPSAVAAHVPPSDPSPGPTRASNPPPHKAPPPAPPVAPRPPPAKPPPPPPPTTTTKKPDYGF